MHYLIAGQGKSGTTALFACLEQSLPPDTHTSFEPRRPEQVASVFDVTAPNTLSKVKLQYLDDRSVDVSRFDKTVLIVRDPRDMLVSRLLYGFYEFQQADLPEAYGRARELLQEKVDDPTSIGFYDLLVAVDELKGRRPATGTKAQRPPLAFALAHDPFVIKYEDFVDGRLEPLERFLGLSLVRDIDVGDRLRRVERTRSYGEWPEWFTEDDLRRLNAEWAQYLEFFGYEPMASAKADPCIREESSMRYVERFRPGT